jgi:hypothetical protein
VGEPAGRGVSLYLKWTSKGRVPSYQGGAPIPYRKWTPTVADPVICERGWHACRWPDAIHHISDELWVCRLAGPIVEGGSKVAGTRLIIDRKVAGITERTLRHFAADCAEQVLPIFEKERPGDDRPRLAIRAARDFADGTIRAAARDTAGDAAWAAARAAARDAGWAAAGAAAGAAAWAAAGDAGWAAAAAAAWAAAWAWQTDRLLIHYGGLNPADFVGGAA